MSNVHPNYHPGFCFNCGRRVDKRKGTYNRETGSVKCGDPGCRPPCSSCKRRDRLLANVEFLLREKLVYEPEPLVDKWLNELDALRMKEEE